MLTERRLPNLIELCPTFAIVGHLLAKLSPNLNKFRQVWQIRHNL